MGKDELNTATTSVNREEGNYQVSIQSSTMPDPEQHMGNCRQHKKTQALMALKYHLNGVSLACR